jgi:hypothetical protein
MSNGSINFGKIFCSLGEFPSTLDFDKKFTLLEMGFSHPKLDGMHGGLKISYVVVKWG